MTNSIKGKVGKITRLLEKKFSTPQRRRRGDPLDILIETILSQNTNDRNRDQAFQKLKSRFPDWEDLATARPRAVIEAIRPGGLARQKTKRILALLRWMKERGGELNLDFLKRMRSEEIRRTLGVLKGIGPKTVHCLLLFGMGREAFPVDTHVLRVGKRLGFIPEKMTAEEAHRWMVPWVPKGKSLSLHLNLIQFGRAICRARNPKCTGCFLSEECIYSS
jgi:endonuclease-3